MIDVILLTGVIVGGALLGPGKSYIVAAKLAKAAMIKKENDVFIVIEQPDGSKFEVIGIGIDENDVKIMLRPDGGDGYVLTAAEVDLLKRVRFIKMCLRDGAPVEERHIREMCKIMDRRTKEIKNTPRRRARRV